MAFTGFADRAATIQRDMDTTIREFRPRKARTLATFESGRSKLAGMAGITIPYWPAHAHGGGTVSPITGDTSYRKSIKQTAKAMFAGLAYRYMNIYLEATVLKDMENGKINDSYIQERRRRIDTYLMEKNWAAIGDGTGTIAVSGASPVAGTTVTLLADNSARGTSKGAYRLQVSTIADPIWYSAIDPALDTEQARFFVTAKLTETTVTVDFTGGVGLITDVDAGDKIVDFRYGWKKEIIGIGGHISDQNRIYQGADTSVDTFLKNPVVDAASTAVTPTMIDAAKNIAMTRANNLDARNGLIAHLTPGNWSTLSAFGYSQRQYQAADGKAQTTFGLPDTYKDGDTVFVPDPDYEDCFIDIRERAPYFEYTQTPFQKKVTGNVSRFQFQGTNNAGSSEEYENYIENTNIVWDGRGMNGDRVGGGGSPNSAVFIKSIALPSVRQSIYGI